MELSCDDKEKRPKAAKLKPDAPEFSTGPKRDAQSQQRIGDVFDQENEDIEC